MTTKTKYIIAAVLVCVIGIAVWLVTNRSEISPAVADNTSLQSNSAPVTVTPAAPSADPVVATTPEPSPEVKPTEPEKTEPSPEPEKEPEKEPVVTPTPEVTETPEPSVEPETPPVEEHTPENPVVTPEVPDETPPTPNQNDKSDAPTPSTEQQGQQNIDRAEQEAEDARQETSGKFTYPEGATTEGLSAMEIQYGYYRIGAQVYDPTGRPCGYLGEYDDSADKDPDKAAENTGNQYNGDGSGSDTSGWN